MHTILVMLASVGLVVGGIAAAALLCWLLWQLFKPIRHPEWAPAGILLLVALALTGHLPRSALLEMAVFFALVAAIPLWFEGMDWRRHHRAGEGEAR